VKREELAIPGVLLLHPEVHPDDRGSFMEIFRQDDLGVPFVQGNHSKSREGVVRGLHYHRKQSDAWYVLQGRARVGLADVRDRSGQALTVDLSGDDPAVLYIPPGVAHGFAALTDIELIYWVTHHYDNSDEFGVSWNDPTLGVPWGVKDPMLSGRDREAPPLDWDEVERVLSA